MNHTSKQWNTNPRPVLLLAGDFDWQHVDVPSLARNLGWEVQVSPSLRSVDVRTEVGAVFCRVDGEDFHSIEEARNLYPSAKIVACSRFRCPVDWDRMEASGAFHHLHLPFDEHEVNVSLGFISAALAKAEPAVAPGPQLVRTHVPTRDKLRPLPSRHREPLRWRLRPA